MNHLCERVILEHRWLDKIQEPFQVERLLDAFATRSGVIPEGAYRVRDPDALAPTLQRVLTEVLTHPWLCFSNGSHAWLLTGIVSTALSRLRNRPVLWVNVYGEDGALIEVGAWAVNHHGKWGRSEHHDIASDT
jgi:hypothetical protein